MTSQPRSIPNVELRLGWVIVYVKEPTIASAFYERAFGLVIAQTIDLPDIKELVMRRPGEDTGFSLILYWNKAGGDVAVGTGHGPLGLYVRDVDAAYAHAVSQGATPHREPWDTEAMRVGFVLDPEGRELELISMRR